MEIKRLWTPVQLQEGIDWYSTPIYAIFSELELERNIDVSSGGWVTHILHLYVRSLERTYDFTSFIFLPSYFQ